MAGALLEQSINLLLLIGISLVAAGLGRLVLGRTSASFVSFGEQALFATGLGLGILSYSTFVLAALQLLYPEGVYILMGLSAVFALLGWLRWRRPPELAGRPTLPDMSFSDRCVGTIVVACLLLGLLLALTPAVGKDALIYHLAVPKLFLKHQGIYFIPGNIFAHYPLNAEMLYVIGLSLRGDILAKGIHFVMVLSILLGMWQFARHHISETRFLPLALLIFYTIPSVFVASHVAYNDLTVSFYTFLAVYAFVNWFSRRHNAWLVLSGVFSGLAVSTKYTALFLPFLGCLGVLWACRRHKQSSQQAARWVLVYLACTLIVGSPFYVKNWIMTANPFYPFLYGFFDGKGWDPEQARLYDLFVLSLGKGRGFWDYLLLPWNVSVNAKMHSPQFDGILGPVFVLTLPFAAGMRRIAIGAKIAIAYCLLTFMFWAASAQQIRYLVPIFPFLAIMTVYILSHYRPRKAVFCVLVALIAGGLGFNGYHIVRDFIKIRPVGVVAGRTPRLRTPTHGCPKTPSSSLPT
jgi:hypothetical protein